MYQLAIFTKLYLFKKLRRNLSICSEGFHILKIYMIKEEEVKQLSH